ncbi:hypothetical protein KSC_059620 [Ktedonobacter sp. SOSP1-52]|uniref:PRC-barrel domain-containing protein n=1 Tax=Ktedonobacter sp. SOSP1-52 TaxID=2778366 RepID=UPI0019157583|nr:PRC-barrel domain-containing protein [Ktedonobacter sp. SOSP1-52]GHO67070.1 hypothetical protein KSC_059620 [Ktedonobacter sp. SOSP1-52]
MQTPANIRKWTELKGIAAVSLDTGKKVGTIEDFYFEPQTSAIYAFQVKTGLFGHHALPLAHIKAIGVDAITFDSEKNLAKEEKGSHLATLPLASVLNQYRVLSEGGTVVGTIGNILLDVVDPTQVRLAGFELAGGLREKLSGHHHMFGANQVASYGHDVIVIPDAVAQTFQ